MRKFQEILTFIHILGPKIYERGILNQKIGFKSGVRPPAEQNSALFSFSDNQWQNMLAFLGISVYFRI